MHQFSERCVFRIVLQTSDMELEGTRRREKGSTLISRRSSRLSDT